MKKSGAGFLLTAGWFLHHSLKVAGGLSISIPKW